MEPIENTAGDASTNPATDAAPAPRRRRTATPPAPESTPASESVAAVSDTTTGDATTVAEA
ncbi:MAG: hypothetical protein H7Y38_18240, partial [Armatimonadetes bacterium]|nr:hypothetical protein [Armatimonadota bacterium]